jgi:hypothetical protein
MARDRINRELDPGESEFAGDPDDVRVGIVAPGPGPNLALNSAYWTNPDDSGSSVAEDGSNIGDTGAQQRRDGEVVRKNQFHIAPPTYPKRYTG